MTALNTLDPDDAFDLPASLGNFYAAMRQLSIAPADEGYRRAAVAGAEALASSLNRASSEVVAARNAADESVAAQAQDAARLAARVASLNAQVRKARANGAEPNDLLDQRLKAAEDLASLTGATISSQDGDVTMRLGAVSLVSGDRAASFSTSPVAGNAGHLALVVSGSDGASQIMDNDAVGGRIGGILHGRDAGLGAVEARIDRLAFDFATRVNGAHSSAVDLDGSTGRDLFVVGGLAGAAGRIAVDPAIIADPDAFAASATGAPGDAGGVHAMLATENGATGDVATLIGDFGAAARNALDEADAANGALAYVVGLRDSATGVSIDEELVEITKAQRTFEAVSKVLQTADSMLNDLLSLR
jgi:flagellar hook-associated protein 1 FlgK